MADNEFKIGGEVNIPQNDADYRIRLVRLEERQKGILPSDDPLIPVGVRVSNDEINREKAQQEAEERQQVAATQTRSTLPKLAIRAQQGRLESYIQIDSGDCLANPVQNRIVERLVEQKKVLHLRPFRIPITKDTPSGWANFRMKFIDPRKFYDEFLNLDEESVDAVEGLIMVSPVAVKNETDDWYKSNASMVIAVFHGARFGDRAVAQAQTKGGESWVYSHDVIKRLDLKLRDLGLPRPGMMLSCDDPDLNTTARFDEDVRASMFPIFGFSRQENVADNLVRSIDGKPILVVDINDWRRRLITDVVGVAGQEAELNRRLRMNYRHHFKHGGASDLVDLIFNKVDKPPVFDGRVIRIRKNS